MSSKLHDFNMKSWKILSALGQLYSLCLGKVEDVILDPFRISWAESYVLP